MQYEEELVLLEHLGKGKKARGNFSLQKYSHADAYWQKSTRDSCNKKSFSTPSSENIRQDFSTPKPSLENMLQTASRKTQAIFKISGYGKGKERIALHLTYISRRGKLELEDQDSNKITSLKAQKEILESWSVDFGKRANSRDTMHLVLSTPPGTDRQKAYLAAKEFLAKEYKENKHEYLFVAHHDTDHPHIHAVIKMVSSLGKKLDPRKAYLRRARQDFVKICRSHGIDVEASSRAERGLSGQSQRSEFVQMKKSGRRPKADADLINKVKTERQQQNTPKHPSQDNMQKRNQIIRKRYADKAKALAQKAKTLSEKSEQEKYQKAAKHLDDYAKTMPVEITRGEKVKQQIDAKLGVTTSRPENVNQELIDEYHAVTIGAKNENGIYESPTKVLSKKIAEIITNEVLAEKSQSKEMGQELEINV